MNIDREILIKAFIIWSEESEGLSPENIKELEKLPKEEYAELSADYLLSVLERIKNEKTKKIKKQ